MEGQIAKSNLIINGVSQAGGGDYALVKIDGVGTIQGNVNAVTMNTNGMTKVLGNVFTEELDCDGMLRVDGHFSSGHSVIDGKMNVKGSLKGEQFILKGVLNIGGDCEIEQFDVQGAFDVKGLLNVGKMNVKLQGRGRAKEIGVESLHVRQGAKSVWNKLWSWMLPNFTPELHVGVIEGDDIDLEYTEADVVRGNRISIGKGCTIGRVEYRTELKKHKGAKIGQEVKTGA